MAMLSSSDFPKASDTAGIHSAGVVPPINGSTVSITSLGVLSISIIGGIIGVSSSIIGAITGAITGVVTISVLIGGIISESITSS